MGPGRGGGQLDQETAEGEEASGRQDGTGPVGLTQICLCQGSVTINAAKEGSVWVLELHAAPPRQNSPFVGPPCTHVVALRLWVEPG